MEARNDSQLADIRLLTGKLCAFQAALVVAHSALAREEAQRIKAQAALRELEDVKATADGPSALGPFFIDTAAVLLCGKKEKKAKRGKKGKRTNKAAVAVLGKVVLPSQKSPAKAILLQDSAIDLAEPRSVPALSPGFDLSQFCWCDEGWHCMCGLPDGP